MNSSSRRQHRVEQVQATAVLLDESPRIAAALKDLVAPFYTVALEVMEP